MSDDDHVTEEERLQFLARIDRIIEESDKVAAGRRRRGRADSDVPDIWRSYSYLRQGYHLGERKSSRRGHLQGGRPRHRGAVCAKCRRTLRLIWDINCSNKRFRREYQQVFRGLDRLPLFYCFDCAEPTVYRCTGPSRIVPIPVPRAPGEESPFQGAAPEILSSQTLSLEAIPTPIENLIVLAQILGFDWLHRHDRARLAKYFGSMRAASEQRRSQFGGLPVLLQGHRDIECPNVRCATHEWGHPRRRRKRYYFMKELAVIDRDCDLGFAMQWAQVAFHICWACNTVHAQHRVD